MIHEGVVTTVGSTGEAHLAPMGFVRRDRSVELRPFVPSTTLENLRGAGLAAMNLTDDVRVIAGCLTGRRDWPVVRTPRGDGWRLAECLAFIELEVTAVEDDPERPLFRCRVVSEESCAPFRGFNRAQAAVVEASILVSRLDWLERDRVAREMAHLHSAVQKTAGAREREAWSWLAEAVASHVRHGPFEEQAS